MFVYVGGFSEEQECIQNFWTVVSAFSDHQRRQLLKFVTSCSRPPLLGFKVSQILYTPYVCRDTYVQLCSYCASECNVRYKMRKLSN